MLATSQIPSLQTRALQKTIKGKEYNFVCCHSLNGKNSRVTEIIFASSNWRSCETSSQKIVNYCKNVVVMVLLTMLHRSYNFCLAENDLESNTQSLSGTQGSKFAFQNIFHTVVGSISKFNFKLKYNTFFYSLVRIRTFAMAVFKSGDRDFK